MESGEDYFRGVHRASSVCVYYDSIIPPEATECSTDMLTACDSFAKHAMRLRKDAWSGRKYFPS